MAEQSEPESPLKVGHQMSEKRQVTNQLSGLLYISGGNNHGSNQLANNKAAANNAINRGGTLVEESTTNAMIMIN